MPEYSGFARDIWALIASVAGSITALSSRPYKKMARVEIAMSVIAGTSFAFFVSPWIATRIFGDGPVDIRVVGGLFYLMACGSNVLIPMAIRSLSRMLGFNEQEEPA